MVWKMVKKKAFTKLLVDIKRYKEDKDIQKGIFGYFILFLFVDFWPVLWFRCLEFCSEKKSIFRKILKMFFRLLQPIVEGMSGSRISLMAEIDEGFVLHQSVGVVVANGTKIGKNCTMMAGAGLVHRANNLAQGAPQIGDNVKIMIGAKIVGSVKIGNKTIVGANAVVLHDMSDCEKAAGIPAKSIGEFDNCIKY